MTKVYKRLTPDQIERGVVFSSTLSEYRTETLLDLTHELTKRDSDEETRLLDDSFFNSSPLWNFNIIRKA